jgi:hypothetical protein
MTAGMNYSAPPLPSKASKIIVNILLGVLGIFVLLMFAACMGSMSKSNDNVAPVDEKSQDATTAKKESTIVPTPVQVDQTKNYDESIPRERDMKILQYAGSTENKTQRPMTLKEGKALLDSLAEVHPDFYKVRTLGWARSVCGDILHGKDEAYILKVMPERFGSRETRVIGPRESQAILDIVKSNGSCEAP